MTIDHTGRILTSREAEEYFRQQVEAEKEKRIKALEELTALSQELVLYEQGSDECKSA